MDAGPHWEGQTKYKGWDDWSECYTLLRRGFGGSERKERGNTQIIPPIDITKGVKECLFYSQAIYHRIFTAFVLFFNWKAPTLFLQTIAQFSDSNVASLKSFDP